MYNVGGKILSKDQVVPYLQGLNIADFTITNMVVKPNGADMTLSYTVAAFLGQRAAADLHGHQRLATGCPGLDPHRAHRTAAIAQQLGSGSEADEDADDCGSVHPRNAC